MIGSEIQITVSNLPRFESWYDLTLSFFLAISRLVQDVRNRLSFVFSIAVYGFEALSYEAFPIDGLTIMSSRCSLSPTPLSCLYRTDDSSILYKFCRHVVIYVPKKRGFRSLKSAEGSPLVDSCHLVAFSTFDHRMSGFELSANLLPSLIPLALRLSAVRRSSAGPPSSRSSRT